MRTLLGKLGLSAAAAIALCACNMVDVYERQIQSASHAIETAGNDTQRAAAYADRGRGYSDKARLTMVRRIIDRDEYVRLFDLAVKDHDQAVALDPGNAEMYYMRGRSYYDRAALADEPGVDHTPWFDAARDDFTRAVERDPRHAVAYDFLGLVDQQTDRFDEAVADYTREMALDSRLGRMRLADLYCERGQSTLREEKYDLAAADLERAVEFGGSADGCSCEPYNALAYIYIDVTHQYDKAWDLLHRSKLGHVIAAEYVERLMKASGRNG